jgi:hypothetical protein
MEALPDWEQGTPAVLCASGPHPIPVSTYVRGGDHLVVIALARPRRTLELLREDPRAALCVLGRGAAFTAHGEARVAREPLRSAGGIAAVELRVERVQDHLADGRTEMLDGARWRWADPRFAEGDEAVFEELRELARSLR